MSGCVGVRGEGRLLSGPEGKGPSLREASGWRVGGRGGVSLKRGDPFWQGLLVTRICIGIRTLRGYQSPCISSFEIAWRVFPSRS